MATCHARTTYGIAWCATGRPLEMISQDAAAFDNSHAVIGPSVGAVSVETESGRSVARQIGRNRGVPQRNHGLLARSQHSIDGAAFWFIALARACQQQLLVEATGIRPQPLSEKTARYSREHVSTADIGWLHLQTLYGHIAETRPDMFAQGANPARGPVGCGGSPVQTRRSRRGRESGPVCPESWRRAQSAAVFMVISLDRSTIVPAPCEPADQE